MAIWRKGMCSMGRLLGGSRKYCNVAGAAAVGGRFHPIIGGRMSITRGGNIGQSLISPSAGKSSPPPLLMLPPELLTPDSYMGGHITNNSTHHYHFMRIEKQLDDVDAGSIHKHLFMLEKKNKSCPPDDAVCRGSSHGWLAFVHQTSREVGLVNPFANNPSCSYVPLPQSQLYICKKCEKKFIWKLKKMALSSAPSPLVGDCDVVGITESESFKFKGLIHCKLGDSDWTNLEGSFEMYSDVVYFSKDRHFYAVPSVYDDEPFDIEAWDFSDPCTPKNFLIKPSHDFTAATVQFPFNPQGWRAKNTPPDENGKIDSHGGTRRYLVEASGDLLLVFRTVLTQVGKDGFLTKGFVGKRNFDGGDHEELRTDITVGFAVLKMNWSENKWEPVESLGDKALFLGLNHSFSVSTHDLPGVMPNSIYFTDDLDDWFHPWGYDTGVFNMEDGFISGILPSSLEKIEQLPVWVLPNPN